MDPVRKQCTLCNIEIQIRNTKNSTTNFEISRYKYEIQKIKIQILKYRDTNTKYKKIKYKFWTAAARIQLKNNSSSNMVGMGWGF